ncbi:hypothetical protein KJA17_00355 [Patescibacteria group bacterium]|nr:hypothetical protein [Patescibacteria group bacterium]
MKGRRTRMHLYVSKLLEGVVPLLEVREEANAIKKGLKGKPKLEQIERASLLSVPFVPREYPEAAPDSGALLVMKRRNGKIGPVFFYGVFKNGYRVDHDLRHLRHLIFLISVHKKHLRKFPNLDRFFPYQYRNCLPD